MVLYEDIGRSWKKILENLPLSSFFPGVLVLLCRIHKQQRFYMSATETGVLMNKYDENIFQKIIRYRSQSIIAFIHIMNKVYSSIINIKRTRINSLCFIFLDLYPIYLKKL